MQEQRTPYQKPPGKALGDIVVLDDSPPAAWEDELTETDLAVVDAIEAAYKVCRCVQYVVTCQEEHFYTQKTSILPHHMSGVKFKSCEQNSCGK